MTTTTPRVVREVVADRDILQALARGRVPWLAGQIEARLRDMLGVRRSDQRVIVEWQAHWRQDGTSPTVTHPVAGQPPAVDERLAWCPGTPLPPRASYATCTVTLDRSGP